MSGDVTFTRFLLEELDGANEASRQILRQLDHGVSLQAFDNLRFSVTSAPLPRTKPTAMNGIKSGTGRILPRVS